MTRRLVRLLPILALSACAVPPASQDVTIDFALRSGDAPVSCEAGVAGLNRSATLTDARLYVYDVALVRADGVAVPVDLTPSSWQRAGLVLLDFENAKGTCRGTPEKNERISGRVPAGRYDGLRFTIGVPENLNHTSTSEEAAPLDSKAMSWSWQAGRKFVKIELDPEGGVVKGAAKPAATWNLHLGSTGCSGDPVKGEKTSCTAPNRVSVALAGFDAARQQVIIDLARLFQGTDLGNDGGGATGCMSGATDPDCTGVFRQLGVNPANPQPAFLRIAPKA